MRKLFLLLLAILCVTTVYSQYQPILYDVPCKIVGGSWFTTDFATGKYLQVLHPTWHTDTLGIFRLSTDTTDLWIQVGNGDSVNSNFAAIGLSYVDSILFGYTASSILRTSLDSLNFSGWTYVGPLPITLASFTGTYFAAGDSIQLRWTTVSEVNNYGFDIQRRLIGTTAYSTLGFVAGHGTTLEPHDYYFTDYEIQTNVQYQYRLHQIDLDGRTTDTEPIEVFTTSVPMGVLPEQFNLFQNYPNPFNPSTVIRFSLNGTAYTTLIIYDMLGQEVDRLVVGILPQGSYETLWDATNRPSGIYVCVLTHVDKRRSIKLILTK